jgi:uncharacterized metal-binding protein
MSADGEQRHMESASWAGEILQLEACTGSCHLAKKMFANAAFQFRASATVWRDGKKTELEVRTGRRDAVERKAVSKSV